MAKRAGVDKWMFFITVLLIVAGLAMVFSASAIMAQERYHSPYTFVLKQALWAVCGIAFLLVLSHIDYTVYKSPRFIYFALSVTILLLVLVFLMPGSHHTHRWIRFGSFFTFQPSEIAKPVLVLFLAWFLSTRLDKMRDWKNTLARAILIPVVLIILIVAQPDLGTALVLAGVTAMMLYLAGMNWKYLAAVVCAALPILAVLLWVPWRRARVMAFLNPNCDAKELPAASYHVCQSLIAVGTGGVAGRGYMEGVQKLFFLPEAHTDFIFANIAEETGFIGAIIIVLLFAAFAVRGLRIAFHVQDPFARFTAFGITVALVLQAFFNISVVLALVPTKGIPLPLISSGGTSIAVTLASIGILLNISRKVD